MITTSLEAVKDEDVINKCYLDEKILKINGHLSLIGKLYDDFKLQYNKQSVEEILIQRAVKTSKQLLYDKNLFDIFPNADSLLKIFRLQQGVEVI